METGWLAEVCSKDPHRDWLAKPIAMTVGKSEVTVATDAMRMVVVDGHVDGAVPLARLGRAVDPTDYAKLPVDGGTLVTRTRLRAWLTKNWKRCLGATCTLCGGTRNVTCDECLGNAKKDCTCVCGFIHVASCGYCTNGHRPCTGMPHGYAAPKRQGWIGSLLFDLALVTPIVENVTDEKIRLVVDEKNKHLRMAGDGWKAIVMMILPRGDERNLRRFRVAA